MGPDTLPAELIERIFSYLSGDREALIACRLVSKDVGPLVDPHLFSRVVFALRRPAIDNLQHIYSYPRFSKFTTELVLDGSRYSRRAALVRTFYAHRCKHARGRHISPETVLPMLDDIIDAIISGKILDTMSDSLSSEIIERGRVASSFDSRLD